MDITALKLKSKSIVDELMIPIVNYFENNKDLSISELSTEWEKIKDQLHINRYEAIWTILIENGVKEPSKFNSDNKIKAILVQHFPKFYDSDIDEYYYTKIKPIIIQNVNL